MLALGGIYNNGHITLDEMVSTKKPVKVIVTFIDEEVVLQKKAININGFSFTQSRELLKEIKGNLSDDIIDERRSGLNNGRC